MLKFASDVVGQPSDLPAEKLILVQNFFEELKARVPN